MIDFDNPEHLALLRSNAEDVIKKAHSLQYMKTSEGWGIVLEAFDDIEGKALHQLSEQQPGNDTAILAAHSVWYSVKHAYANVRKAVDDAILDGMQAAELLQDIDKNDNWS